MALMKWASNKIACQQGWYRESRPFFGRDFFVFKNKDLKENRVWNIKIHY
ncbi:hypothetical protein M643_05400 [Listeria monocytogenes]|nr:hypothetical protein M643_05400 [Listeria monocytogenes]